jgi:hypothetical protein
MTDDRTSFAKPPANEAASDLTFVQQTSAQAGSALPESSDEIYREWINWFMASAEKSRDGLATLARCASPQEFASAQNRLIREHVELLVATGQKILDMSAEVSKRRAADASAGRQSSGP